METSGIFRRCQISIEKLEARTHFTTALWSFLHEIVQDPYRQFNTAKMLKYEDDLSTCPIISIF